MILNEKPIFSKCLIKTDKSLEKHDKLDNIDNNDNNNDKVDISEDELKKKMIKKRY